MRLPKLAVLTATCVLLPSLAHAYAFHLESRGSTAGLYPGDSVVIDVFLDRAAEDSALGIASFSLGVHFDASSLFYDAAASAALPIVNPGPTAGYGTTGARPGYILYQSHRGALYPSNWETQAAFLEGPAAGRVDVAYEAELGSIDFLWYPEEGITYSHMGAEGSLWIATLLFHVSPGALDSLIEIDMEDGASFLESSTDGPQLVDPSNVAVGAPILVTIPEPGVALLLVVGGAFALLVSRRR